jgi:hypothetical protein
MHWLQKKPKFPQSRAPQSGGTFYLERIVNKSLEKHRNLRYQTAAEMRVNLLR